MCTGAELMFVAQAAGSVGSMMQGQQEAKGYYKQAGEVLANAKEEQENTSRMQERRRGGIRAAYGKSGVMLKGTAVRTIEEQIRQDERDLLSIKYNAYVKANDLKQAGMNTAKKGYMEAFGKGANAFGGASGQNIFGFNL